MRAKYIFLTFIFICALQVFISNYTKSHRDSTENRRENLNAFQRGLGLFSILFK